MFNSKTIQLYYVSEINILWLFICSYNIFSYWCKIPFSLNYCHGQRRLDVWDQSSYRLGAWGEPASRVTDQLSLQPAQKELPRVSYVRALMPFGSTPLSRPHHLPKAPLAHITILKWYTWIWRRGNKVILQPHSIPVVHSLRYNLK